METVFVRLKLPSTKSVSQELWNRRLIAVRCGDSYSLNPDDYPPAGRNPLKLLHSCCQDGAIVAADFRDLHQDRLLVGEILPGSEMRAEAIGEEKLIYKVVTLKNFREVSYIDYPVLLASQPQRGTLVRWPSAHSVLKNALYGEPLKITLSLLAPDQVEILCYEYLRRFLAMSRLLLPIGRGLTGIDIFGIDAYQRTVLAQIAQSHDVRENDRKLANLQAYRTRGSVLYYFGQAKPLRAPSDVTFLKIENVFYDSLDRDESRQMIFRMLGQNDSREIRAFAIYDRPRNIDNQNLKCEDIPDDMAPIQQFDYFALSFDAYQYWESREKKLNRECARDCNCLSHLRTRLFRLQRAGHFGNGLSRSEVIPLTRAIRRAVESRKSTWC